MKRYIKIYFKLILQHLKSILEYRVDFLIGILSFIFIQISGIIFLDVLVKDTGILGWSYYELLVIYGMFQIPRGIDHLLTDNLWLISYYVRRGLFDKYLTRPINVLFHIIAERFQIEAFGELIVGITILAIAIPKLSLKITFLNVIYLILFIIIGSIMYTCIKLMASSLAFWTKDSQPIVSLSYEVATFTKNPIEIYPQPLRFLLVYILPFAFTSYFPSIYILSRFGSDFEGLDWVIIKSPEGLLLQGFITMFFFILIALFIWNKGLKRYESAGS